MSLLHSIQRQFSHDAWAKARLAEAVHQLTDAEFARDLGPGLGSVRAKFCHTVDAEHLWHQRIVEGISASERPNDSRHGTREDFLHWYEQVQARKQALVNGLTEDRLRANVSYKNLGGKAFTQPLYELLQHVALHAAYHRGQVAACLRALGKQPPATDYIDWSRENPA
ncbi:MAG: DinB family protein [Planctomycetes bacterium]|nr:DinB family protein [Planctomycetota bacterium]